MLTRQDLDNFGPELLDVAQRAAHHAMGPELQRLHDENEQLRDEVTRAAKTAIDQYLDANVPNWREINNDPRFQSWLLQPEPYSGVVRDRLLKDAAHAADAARVASFFKGFIAQEGAAGQTPARTTAGRAAARSPSGQRIYNRDEITRMWSLRRQGKIDDAAWTRWEYELCRASAEGRVRGALSLEDGVPVSR